MPYPGGKGSAGVCQTIINHMPPHETYIEAFLGHGAVMAAKRPALRNIGVDMDAAAIAYARSRIVGSGEAAVSPELAMHDSAAITYEFHVADGVEFLKAYPFRGGELVYCDPPYLHSTRRELDLYRHEMTDQQHEGLLAVLLRLPCPVILSGRWSALYADTLRTWRTSSFAAQTRGGRVVETLWCNFSAPHALHGYEHLGENFREREKLKRLKRRWVRRWLAMPLLERQAVLTALKEADNGASSGIAMLQHRQRER